MVLKTTHRFLYQSFLFIGMVCLNINCQSDQNTDTGDDIDIYAEHVRSTDFQSPEEERQSFILPPGFKATLFASEPDITKPINMAFDQKGRLWVTQSSEYPIAAGESQGRDKISILEDTDGDGKADKITDFVNDLNIPIGVMPMHDGVIAYSIPNVYYFKDLNQDDVLDGVDTLLGPFGHDDTHGMINNFARGYDGWIYGCHGFSNTSTVAAADGDSITMVSGNTFRFDAQGQRLEQTTYGRVNPFGYAFDEWGYLYSADCHSKPLYQIVPQGDYPHFGKKPPSLGFGPEMMDFNLGSTAIAGLALYGHHQFPEEYQNCFYAGDVVTCRVDRMAFDFEGSTPKAEKREPLLVSKDPWFRPVDVKVGPDGAVYVADFYNKIIGHYEVSLDHEGRDRTSGRIWKITYEGEDGVTGDVGKNYTANSSMTDLIQGLNSPVLQTRMLCADILVDHYGVECVGDLRTALLDRNVSSNTFIHAMWILHRLGQLPDNILNRALSHDDPRVQVHGIRIVREQPTLSLQRQRYLKTALINGDNVHVNRVSAEALGHFTDASHVGALVEKYLSTAEYDTHLAYTCLLGVQLNLRNPAILKDLHKGAWLDNEYKVLIKAILDIPSQDGAELVMRNAGRLSYTVAELQPILTYIAANGNSSWVNSFLQENPAYTSLSLFHQYLLLKALEDGLSRGGKKGGNFINSWTGQLTQSLFAELQTVKDFDNIDDDVLKSYEWAIKKVRGEQDPSITANLQSVLRSSHHPAMIRIAAAEALLTSEDDSNGTLLMDLVKDNEVNEEVKVGLVELIGIHKITGAESLFQSVLSTSGRNLQLAVAQQLTQSGSGIDILLSTVAEEKLRFDVLQQKQLDQVLKSEMTAKQKEIWSGLEDKYGDVFKQKEALIKERRSAFVEDKDEINNGLNVFKSNCGICHQVDGEGKTIGPQLDGIGNWGPKALIEKILDPNRNISPSFRTYYITLKDGKKMTGLLRRTEGQELIFADMAGEEFALAKTDIESQTHMANTLMPDQFSNTISPSDFNALINYLLSVK
ncbi:PVC-type heme-binding CxxCH protein [Membranihabitans marinus]|uniref:PVC-type heme-binding CxxCH protein n=1 Tax=Membranihabitans marinus TaxID=1227546 RepID=UPI001F013014|nr:PVC-type heme-binding CxxCH protein [Membranihabitans marinus]